MSEHGHQWTWTVVFGFSLAMLIYAGVKTYGWEILPVVALVLVAALFLGGPVKRVEERET